MLRLLQLSDLLLVNSQYILLLLLELSLVDNFVVLLFHYVLHRFFELFTKNVLPVLEVAGFREYFTSRDKSIIYYYSVILCCWFSIC